MWLASYSMSCIVSVLPFTGVGAGGEPGSRPPRSSPGRGTRQGQTHPAQLPQVQAKEKQTQGSVPTSVQL